MVRSTGKCKICGYTVNVGKTNTPPDIAAEGVMESIQEHIFRHHCNSNLNLIEGDYESVGKAWKYI